jgi:tripartite-type tricarboxylate transporter receptor subunit TctC
MFGPKSLSPELRKRIGDEVAAVARMPEVADKLVASGQVPNPGGADDFSADIVKQEQQVAAIAKLIGLKRMDP